MPRVFSAIGFHLILPTIPVFESGFKGLLRIREDVFVFKEKVICSGLLFIIPLAAALRSGERL
jgi:hypothetical protein